MSVTIRFRKRAKGKALYLDIYENGVRRSESLDLWLIGDRTVDHLTWEEARSKKALYELSLGVPNNAVRLADYMRSIAENESLAEASRRSWISVAKVFEAYSNPALAAIDVKWLEATKEYLRSHYKQNSASLFYRMMATALNRAERHELLRSNPARKVRGIPKKDTDIVALELDEVRLLANTPCGDPAVKNAFLFSCFHGLRFSDVSRLSPAMIHNRQIVLRMQKTDDAVYIPLHPIADELLGEATNGRYFDLPSQQNTHYRIRNWGRAAGLTHELHFHVSRHTFATMMLEHTSDIYLVSKLMGHRSIKETERYAKIVDRRRKQAVLTLPGL
jgi:integrase/recombinase XerD